MPVMPDLSLWPNTYTTVMFDKDPAADDTVKGSEVRQNKSLPVCSRTKKSPTFCFCSQVLQPVCRFHLFFRIVVSLSLLCCVLRARHVGLSIEPEACRLQYMCCCGVFRFTFLYRTLNLPSKQDVDVCL